MNVKSDKRQQPVTSTVKGTSTLAVKVAKLLVSLATHDHIGSTLGIADLAKDGFSKQLEAAIQKLQKQEIRWQILRHVKQQARRDGCTLDLDDLDREAQVTLEAGLDFGNLLDNYEHLENLPPLWNKRRTAPLGRGNPEYDKYHDLLVVENVRTYAFDGV